MSVIAESAACARRNLRAEVPLMSSSARVHDPSAPYDGAPPHTNGEEDA